MRTMKQRERREALDGEMEYKKFLQNEQRRVNNKSYQNGQESHTEVPKVSDKSVEKHERNEEKKRIQSKVEKLHNNRPRLGNDDKLVNL